MNNRHRAFTQLSSLIYQKKVDYEQTTAKLSFLIVPFLGDKCLCFNVKKPKL